jgi:hypothetical protein
MMNVDDEAYSKLICDISLLKKGLRFSIKKVRARSFILDFKTAGFCNKKKKKKNPAEKIEVSDILYFECVKISTGYQIQRDPAKTNGP